MRVKLIFEGNTAALAIEPTSQEDAALLKAFGISGPLQAEAHVAGYASEYQRNDFGIKAGDPLGVRVVVRRAPPPTAPID